MLPQFFNCISAHIPPTPHFHVVEVGWGGVVVWRGWGLLQAAVTNPDSTGLLRVQKAATARYRDAKLQWYHTSIPSS